MASGVKEEGEGARRRPEGEGERVPAVIVGKERRDGGMGIVWVLEVSGAEKGGDGDGVERVGRR